MERGSRIREYCHVNHYCFHRPLGSELTGIIGFRSNSTYYRYTMAHKQSPSLLAAYELSFHEARLYLPRRHFHI
jgi:hypothetical protein